jgi:hypothetical protein
VGGVKDTVAKSDTAELWASILKFDLRWLILKEISIKNDTQAVFKVFYTTVYLQHLHSRFHNRVSLQIRAICKKALNRGSEAQMESFDEKNGGRTSRDRVPVPVMFYV